MRNKILLATITMLIIYGCREEFAPPVTTDNSSYLVVQGYVNTGGNSIITTINLSRTTALKSVTNNSPELNAVVDIQGDDNSDLVLPGAGNGIYSGNTQTLKTQVKYKLHIKTSNGKEYLSDFLASRITPPIDSITYKLNTKALTVSINTHDPVNNTRYYKWNYSETWQVQSVDTSLYQFKNDQMVLRDPTINLRNCWANDVSTDILIGSSAKLSSDIILNNPLVSISPVSQKISTLYSILVTQYGLTQAGYDYLVTLKKNTEQLGSIFSALPSDIKGNMHSVNNPQELVVGYIDAGIVQQKRLFINANTLPLTNWKAIQANLNNCNPYVVPLALDSLRLYALTDLFIDRHLNKFGILDGYTAEPAICLDCRLTGSSVKPSFWP